MTDFFSKWRENDRKPRKSSFYGIIKKYEFRGGFRKMKQIFEQIKSFVEKRATIIKLIFVLSVVIFVTVEVSRIFREIDWYQVGAGLSDQSLLSILTMLIFGVIAVCPMLIYDFSIVKFLPDKYSTWYIVRSGWITNTATNIAGFGGFLGAALRADFYHKNASKKQVVYALSKIALFLLAGLSIYCWVSLGLIYGLDLGIHLRRYWIWLVGGGLYFPIIFLTTKIKRGDFFKDLTLRREIILVLGSLLEWGFAAAFFLLIGKILGIHTNYAAVLALYFTGSVLGIVSMVPGGLGSFDVFMMLGLLPFGVSTETVVVWLLFFRLFYYIVPFGIGVGLFSHYMGAQFNQKLNGVPRMLLQKTAHFLVTLFLYTSGILLLLEAAVPNWAYSNSVLANLYPYTFLFINQMTDIVFAFLLLGMARGIQAKVKKAYWPTLVILLVGIGNTLWRVYTPTLALFLGVVLVMVILSRKELYRKQLRYSITQRIVDGSIFVGTFFLYAIVGVINSPGYIHHHRIPSILLFPAQSIWFSGFIGLLIAALVLLLINNYLCGGNDLLANWDFSAERVKNVIEKFGGNEVSHLAFLQDKNIYFYSQDGEDKVFFMYRIKTNKLIIMGEPVGDKTYFQAAVQAFMDDADNYDYQLVFYEINEEFTMLLHEYGFDFIKTGEEGLVKLSDFTLQGKKRRAQRALMNKFEREGYDFSFITPPYSDAVMAELKQVSDSWLGKQNEKGFSLGFFDKDYLEKAPVCVVKDQAGKIVAFASMMPMDEKTLSIDLMRHSQDAPSGIMDKIFISLFEYGKEQGYEYFDMGMAPLSNVGESRFSFIGERVARIIFEYGDRFYAFQGLRSYKNKYVTKWSSKYTAYRKRSSLIDTMLLVTLTVNQKHTGLTKPKNRRDYLIPKFLQ